MATTAEIYAPVDAPPSPPRPYGLFSVSPPVDGGERWRVGVGMQSHNCMDANVWRDACIGGVAPVPKEVSAWDCDVTVFDPFTVYLLTSRTGIDYDLASPQVTESFLAVEQRAVEAQLWAQIVAAAPPTTTRSLREGLAETEYMLGANYNGTGVIHVSPYTATMLADYLVADGDALYTKACHTPVVVGNGYADAALPDMEIFGTGAVFVRRGELSDLSAWDLSINDMNAMAERTYLVGWDCYAVGFNITEAP